MLTAIQRVHAKNGPWLNDSGYEYNLVLIAAALVLAEVEPGPLSMDAAMGRERSGSGWALAALGAVGSYLAAEAQPQPPETGTDQANARPSVEAPS